MFAQGSHSSVRTNCMIGATMGMVCGVVAAIAMQNSANTVAVLSQPLTSAVGSSTMAPLSMRTQRVVPFASRSGYSVPEEVSAPVEFETVAASSSSSSLPYMGALFASVAGLAMFWRKATQSSPRVGLEDVTADHRVMLAAVAEAEEATAPAVFKPASKKVQVRKPKGSKRRRALDAVYTKKQLYSLDEALQLAKETSTASFVESIDVAVNLGIDPRKSDQMVRGSVVLPAGTGKTVRVAAFCQGDALDKAKAAGAEFYGLQDLAELIKGGELGFDVVVATPDAMRVALQLGKILGPRGLMPNPKDGTVNVDIEEAIRNAKAGQVKYRSDKAGTVHCPVGKSDFDIAKLKQNVNALLKELMKVKPATVKGIYMRKVVVSSTMGPGICVDISSTDASK